MRTETARPFTPRVRRVALAGAAIGLLIVAAGCSSSAKASPPVPTSSTRPGAVTATVGTAPTSAPTTLPVRSGGGVPHPTTAPAPTGPPPAIATFVTPEDIDCHNGDSQPFSASWTTTNAVKSTIAIDGGGVYRTYGANASDSLPFDCSSAHTFVLTAYSHDGRTASRSITLQPRNVQDTTSTTDGSTTDGSTIAPPLDTVP